MGIPTEVLAWPVSRAPKRPRCANPRLLPELASVLKTSANHLGRRHCPLCLLWLPEDSAHTTCTLGVSPPCWPPLDPPRRPGTTESALSHREHSAHSVQSHTSTTTATWLLRNLAPVWRFPVAAPRAGIHAHALELGQCQPGSGGGTGNPGSGPVSADLQ